MENHKREWKEYVNSRIYKSGKKAEPFQKKSTKNPEANMHLMNVIKQLNYSLK